MKWTYEILCHFYSEAAIEAMLLTDALVMEKSSSGIIGDEFDIIDHSLPELEVVFLPSRYFEAGEKIVYFEENNKIKSKVYSGNTWDIPIRWGLVIKQKRETI